MRSDAGTRLAVLLVLLSSCASADDLRHAYTGRHAGFGQDLGVSDSGPGDLTQDEGKADPGPADPGADDGWIDPGPTDPGVADEGIDADADACVPDCTGKSCGATDGCGGKCTGCVANATCNTETWSCDCPGPWCASGSMCCGKGQTCEAGDTCTGTCQPQCAGKECGPNGCPGGGTCGTCDGGKQCESGKCVCKLQDHKGCVGGNVNWYDSCGVEGTVAETCGCGCTGAACDCCPSWSCTGWSVCSCGGTQTRTCTDSNGCGVGTGKPAESQTCDHCGNGSCDCGETYETCPQDGCCKLQDHKACSGGNLYWYDSCGVQGSLAQTCSCGCTGSTCDCCPSWSCGGWSVCSCGNTQTRTCTDSNGCGTATGKPAESQTCNHCGNGSCDCGETYATCPQDGCCKPQDHKACSGGILYWYDSCGVQGSWAQICSCGCTGSTCDCCPSWSCGGWSVCSCGNTQTRTCTDSKGCGTATGKPAESQSCDHCGNGTCDCEETTGTCSKDCPVCSGTTCPVVSGYTMSCNKKGACEYSGGPGGAMVYVPAGAFWMGANKDWTQCPTNTKDSGADSSELPCHQVVPGFLVDKTEVTVDAYVAWLYGGGGGCLKPSGSDCVAGTTGVSGDCAPSTGGSCNYQVGGKGSYPVNCVNWCELKAYCASVGKRLCSEAEWEKAARGTSGDLYPWGDQEATCEYAVMDWGCGTGSTKWVGSKSPAGDSPYGAQDMAGNEWEWVEDDWHDTYTGAPLNGSAWVETPRGSHRVSRGSGYSGGDNDMRASYRHGYDLLVAGVKAHGGRCCRSP